MNVVVCVKQIPDPAVPGGLEGDHTLDRSGKLILDESDSYGVEMALQLVTAAGDGEVTLVSMAPNGEVSGLRTALAMGAAKAILVSDPALEGSDALSTAKVLAKSAPERMLWATNWPHPTPGAPVPDDAWMLDMLLDWIPDQAARRKALVENPAQLYGF